MEDVMQVQDVMTQHVISVQPSDAITRAIRLMLQERVSGLPVIDGSGRLVGDRHAAPTSALARIPRRPGRHGR
jgi:CBS domain-containing protein